MDNCRLCIGIDAETGEPIYITLEQLSTHLHCIGGTGSGKSKWLEQIIREVIRKGFGLCVIDPHGSLFMSILKWLTALSWPVEKITLFDPSDPKYVTGYNPLHIRVNELSYHVGNMTLATAQAWGRPDLFETPLLHRVLTIIYFLLAEKKLSLLEAQYLLMPTQKTARKVLTSDIQNSIIKDLWDYYTDTKMPLRQFMEDFGSSANRLLAFLRSERIRKIIGQTTNVIRFDTIMNDGQILLCNLCTGNVLAAEDSRLLGTLLVNELFSTAMERQKGSRPFILIIDECWLYISPTIAKILDQTRKYGLFLILAHQYVAQVREVSEIVYNSLMADAKTKVVFAVSPEDADVFVKPLFLREIDPDKYKHSLDRPTVVDYRTRYFESVAEGETFGTSQTDTFSEMTGSGMADTFGAASRSEIGGGSMTAAGTLSFANSFTMHSSSGSGSGQSTSHHRSTQKGSCEGLEPKLEVRSTATYSIDEQSLEKTQIIVNQPQRHAVVKLPERPARQMVVPFVQELVTADDQATRYYMTRVNEASPFTKTQEEADREIETRQQQLLAAFAAYELERVSEPTKHKQQRKKPGNGKDSIEGMSAPHQARQKKQKPID